ncbi:MAG: hypothetical protein WBW53_15725 [Terriglobales bacterium]
MPKLLRFAVIVICLASTGAHGGTNTLGGRHAEGRATESSPRGQLPLTKFYDTPVPFSAGKPGELIRSEPFSDYYLPAGVSAMRILYHSVAANGQDVAASGVVLTPDGTPPAGGWPVIAWAHKFLGIARTCAPSLMSNLHSGPFLGMYVNLGYAIVATDYLGLGTVFRNAYVDVGSNASDVMYSVPAARAALPQLGLRWVAMGDAEGGAAVLALAEIESHENDPNFLGSVAISGAIDLKSTLYRPSRGLWKDSFAALAYGIETVYPEFHVDDILKEKALARYREIGSTCSLREDDHAPPLGDMLKASWESDPYVGRFLQRNVLGLSHARTPLMVISGEDPVADASMAAQVVNRMCHQKDRVDFERYPGLEAADVIGGSVAGQIAWIKGRFSGQPIRNTCP